MFNDIYRGKRVLVTGHAGFCGSWLCLWLERLGAKVIKYGHAPNTTPNHYTLLGNPVEPIGRLFADLLDKERLAYTIQQHKPNLVIHLAAKAILTRAFHEPQETFENNIMGAVNILEISRQCPDTMGVVVITTDKIYADQKWTWGYRENDEMGGEDPYSASKVCVEHVIQCYRKSFGMNIAVARAGNVIGGGDWSHGRLIPNAINATIRGERVIAYTPNATRPWQHVLEALSGYLMLGQKIMEEVDVNKAWNFGPDEEMTVLELLQIAHDVWPEIRWEIDETEVHPFMVYLLRIDSTNSKKMGWSLVWSIRETVERAIRWYKVYYQDGLINSDNDIHEYERRM